MTDDGRSKQRPYGVGVGWRSEQRPNGMTEARRRRGIAAGVVGCVLALCAALALAAGGGSAAVALAVGGGSAAQGAWVDPYNLSANGAASAPVVAVASNGVLHVLWWDAFDGAMQPSLDLKSSKPLATPAAVPDIVGQRTVSAQTGQVTSLSAPRGLRLVAGAGGSVHALWQTASNLLLTAAYDGVQWSAPVTLTQSPVALNVAPDASGAVRIAYVRPSPPSGVYVQVLAGEAWSEPITVTQSPYFRTAKAESMHTSVAALAGGRMVVAWDDPLLDQSVYAYSSDNGATWSVQEAVVGRQNQRVQKARVAAAANGELLLIWQDAASGGCGLTQARSSDGGKTWSAAERVMTTLARCPATWRFSTAGDGRLWLLGLPAADGEGTLQAGVVAAWDGSAWSQPADVSVSFQNATTGRTATLGCLNLALGGARLGVTGCDDKGDVWLTYNAVPLDQLAPALQPLWSAPHTLSDGAGEADLPALAAGTDGRAYAMWSQKTAAGGEALHVAAWDGSRWGQATAAFSTTINVVLVEADTQTRAEQPALAVDARGRLHAVWSGGVSGRIMYSWVFGREAASQAWAYPEELPAPSNVGGWPDIVADPRGDVLHVAYSVPYNEQRGVYYVRSVAQGALAVADWLTPTVVFDAVAAGWDGLGKTRLALDATSGTLHAVWLRTGVPGAMPVQAVYYARSADDGKTWSTALKVIEGNVDWPRVVVTGGQTHLLWNKLRPDGSAEVWQQWSSDGGQRWSTATAVRGFDRLSGPASVVAAGGALWLAGVSESANGEATLLSAQWNGSSWSRAESFGLGQDAASGNAATATLAGKNDQLTVALRRATRQQDGSTQFAIAALSRAVTAAAITPAPTFTALPTRTPQATATPLLEFPMPDGSATPANDPISRRLPAFVGGALAVLLVGAAVATRGVWSKWRR